MKRGFVRVSPRFPATEQREAMMRNGVTERAIYEGNVEDFIKSLRKGDVACVYGIDRLAPSWTKIRVALDAIWERGASILDLTSNALITAEAVVAVARARSICAGEARIPSREEAIRRGAKGGGQLKQRRLTRWAIKAMWFDKSIPSNTDVANKCDVPIRTLYNWFGKSGREAGWPVERLRHKRKAPK
jgi:hypothetical protein